MEPNPPYDAEKEELEILRFSTIPPDAPDTLDAVVLWFLPFR